MLYIGVNMLYVQQQCFLHAHSSMFAGALVAAEHLFHQDQSH